MSIIFGICNTDDRIVEEEQLLEFAQATARFGPDGTFSKANGNIGMGFQAFYTHARSKFESVPLSDSLGNLLVFDGRLDNQAELRALLDLRDPHTSDSFIVLRAFSRWGEDFFGRLTGEWALALWSQLDRSLYLARDHAGTRTLYFEAVNGRILWSTYLETFFTEPRSREIDEAYAHSYLVCQPLRDLTPYKGIRAVPAAHYLKFNGTQSFRRAHWQCVSTDQIRYQTDSEYDDHFLSLFRQAVARRSESGESVLAQLSGGMDSTSIVCMSDQIRRANDPKAELIDTVSFYDDTDPDWGEKPYFLRVEGDRCKNGIHIPSADRWTFEPADRSFGQYLLPGADAGSIEREKQFHAVIGTEYRAILSGIGGDELLGGVPTPFPELADHLVGLRLVQLLRRSVSWCLIDRKPLVHTLVELLRFTLGLYCLPGLIGRRRVPWVRSSRLPSRSTNSHKSETLSRSGTRPSGISSQLTWHWVTETLPHLHPGLLARPEYRYPYLDRNLADFLVRVPREHLVGPGRRRLLMRRSLRGITPSYILERRRKAYLARSPIAALSGAREKIALLFDDSLAAAHGFIEPAQFLTAFQNAVDTGNSEWLIPLLKAIGFELWLRAT